MAQEDERLVSMGGISGFEYVEGETVGGAADLGLYNAVWQRQRWKMRS